MCLLAPMGCGHPLVAEWSAWAGSEVVEQPCPSVSQSNFARQQIRVVIGVKEIHYKYRLYDMNILHNLFIQIDMTLDVISYLVLPGSPRWEIKFRVTNI